jgi:nicotinate-nucleotide pyrophosphorylase (carboxylating)
VREAARPAPTLLLLDNMTPDGVRAVVDEVRAEHPPAAAGDLGAVDLETIRLYATTGGDLVSIGALTHSRARPRHRRST